MRIGARVDERDSEGQTPLMVAASWGQPDAIRALVEGGADTSLQDEGGDTALHEAARADEVLSLLALLELGADKDPRNKLGATPLHLASHLSNGAACKALIRGGAAVTGAKSLMKGGYSPLHAAAANGSTECLQDLLAAGSSLKHSASESSLRGGSVTFTIDPKDAKDFDDALSFTKLENGNYEIGIHIADVSHYVQPNTVLDDEAYSRATSVYLVDRVVPMLPEMLSNGACSLRPNEEKLTFSAVFEINEKAQVIHEWFGRTVTYSDKRFAYEEAQVIIETKKNFIPENVSITDESYKVSDHIVEATLKLNELAKILRKKRMQEGAISFDRVEVKFHLDEEANPVGVFFKEAKDANKLIEEFMLLANRKVAEFIGQEKNKPTNKTFIYRVHDEPDVEKLAALQNIVFNFGYKMDTQTKESTTESLNKLLKDVHGKAEANMIETLAIRTMSKAVYTTQNIGHYGLAFDYYSHFTSPIRRYPDVMTHRLLQHYLDGENSPKQDDYEAKCKHASKREELASKAERQSIKYMQVKYMQDHQEEEFLGVISGVTEWGIYVEITSNKCEGMVRIRDIKNDYYIFDEKQYAIIGQTTKHIYQLGDQVTVKVKHTDLERKHLDFSLIEQ